MLNNTIVVSGFALYFFCQGNGNIVLGGTKHKKNACFLNSVVSILYLHSNNIKPLNIN